jgi:Lar family restriction alleviation protein
MTEQELKPRACPFCGGAADVRRMGNEHTPSRATQITCSQCNTSKKVGAIRNTLDWTTEQCITAWNRRTPDPEFCRLAAEAATILSRIDCEASRYAVFVPDVIDALRSGDKAALGRLIEAMK